MFELTTAKISSTLTAYTNKICKGCNNDDCASCDIEPIIKIIDRINDGEPVLDDTSLNIGENNGKSSKIQE